MERGRWTESEKMCDDYNERNEERNEERKNENI